MAATAGPGSPPTTRVARAERFVWLTARVLEQRRFAFHFTGGAAEPVEAALSAYRNEDGGYAHALDPDLRGPLSDPRHVAHALRVLGEIGRCEGRHTREVCRYLAATAGADGGLPAAHGRSTAPPPAGAHPLAADLATTAAVLAALHRNGVWHPWLFRATDLCWARVDALERPRPHEVAAALAFLDAAPDRPRARIAAERLERLVRERRLVSAEPEPGPSAGRPAEGMDGPRRYLLPHELAPAPDGLARRWFTDAEMDRSLDLLSAGQRADGGWPARQRSGTPAADLERRPIATIEALLVLRRYGRLG